MVDNKPVIKIQLSFNTNNADEVRSYFHTIYRWQKIVHKSANLILTHLFIMMNIKDMVYLSEKMKVKLANVSEDSSGILNSSKKHATYQMLNANFKKDIPSSILSAINSQVITEFNNSRADYYTGRQAIQSFPSSLDIPFYPADVRKLKQDISKDNGEEIAIYTFGFHKLPMRVILKTNTKEHIFMNMLREGKVKLNSPRLHINQNRIYIISTFKEVPASTALRISFQE